MAKEKKSSPKSNKKKAPLLGRAPVVTLMGHVDHGKTSLLDVIRQSSLTEKEYGGITQHIGAYEVEVPDGRKITFIDTPGHAAFTQMRARGGQAADIVILVVAANDGVMPQTKEAIDHARAAQAPIIVAINKMDLDSADPNKVKQQLAEYGVLVEGWGGDVVCAEVSAKTKQGIDGLLEMILLVAEMLELEAKPDAELHGLVIESWLHPQKGALVTTLIQDGTLRVGDDITVGAVSGRVKSLINYLGQSVKSATPSMPVEVLGLKEVPEIGSPLVAKGKADAERSEESPVVAGTTLAAISQETATSEVKILNLVLKGDVQGSLEAIQPVLLRLESAETQIRILHASTGAVSESDVLLATAGGAVILAFNVKVGNDVKFLATQHGVEIRSYTIIYKLLEDVENALKGMEIATEMSIKGRGEVLATFTLPSNDLIVGAKVVGGRLRVGDRVEIWREGEEEALHTAKIKNIKRGHEVVVQATKEMECGLLLKPQYLEVKKGDRLEVL